IWQAGSASSSTAQIYGLQLNGNTGNPSQSQEFKITSRTDSSLPERLTPGASVGANLVQGEYIVVWAGSDGRIYGQRFDSATGQIVGPAHLPISLSAQGSLPQVEFNPGENEYLVVWERQRFGGKTEIAGQRLSGNRGLKIDKIGFQISEMGPVDSAAFGAFRPALVFDSENLRSVAVWDGNTRANGGNQVLGATVLSSSTGAGRVRWLLTGAEAKESTSSTSGFFGASTIDSDDSVYTAGGYGALSKLSPDGSPVWTLTQAEVGSKPSSAPALAKDGTLFLVGESSEGSAQGHLKSFLPTGTENWSFPVQETSWVGIALNDSASILYGTQIENGVTAIDFEGEVSWTYVPEGRAAVTSPIVTTSGQILVGMTEPADGGHSYLYALHANGTVAWITELDWSIGMGHALARGRDGTTYVGGAMLGAISSDGALKWKVPAGGNLESEFCYPMIGKDGTVYCGSRNTIQAFSPEGVRLFVFLSDLEAEVFSKYAAIGPDRTLYALSNYTGALTPWHGWGRLHAIDKDGNLRWKIDFPDETFLNSIPVLANSGDLYLASDQGNLYSVRTGSSGENTLEWPMVAHDARHTGQTEQTERHQLYFAQFADGGGVLFSQILLFNPDESSSVTGTLHLRDDSGSPLTVDLNHELITGEKDLEIAPSSTLILATDSVGDLVVGSASVESDRRLGGVVKFGGSVGLAGVGNSAELSQGFLAPMESNRQAAINTGVALMNLSDEPADLELELYSMGGKKLAAAVLAGAQGLPAHGHTARFVDQFTWNTTIDFTEFAGLLKVAANRPISATVIQSRPGEFATMPVSPSSSQKWGKLIGRDSSLNTLVDSSHSLYFAQFAEGGGALFSQIVLFNPDDSAPAEALVSLRNDEGAPLTVDLNGIVVEGSVSVTIPASSMQVLKTDGLGPVVVGSATVTSNQPLAGVIVFGGSVGLAGVGSSPEISGEFLAPMQTDQQEQVNTGIALMNLSDSSAAINLELLSDSGEVLGTATLAGELALAPRGHRALFLDQFDWDRPIDFAHFNGLLKVQSSEPLSATVIQTSPGQFATMPVVVN
ncbi:MAG: PQQ-like beta-propeller repeat protein, partial [Acidobacteriota bacterium]